MKFQAIDTKVKLATRVIEVFKNKKITQKMKPKLFLILALLLSFNVKLLTQVKKDILKIKGKVVFLTSDGVYFNFGRNDGVTAGDTVKIYRNGRKIETLVISLTSSKRSVARATPEKISRINIGDIAVVIKPKLVELKQKVEKKAKKKEKETIVVEKAKPAREIKAFAKPSFREKLNLYGRISFQDFSSFSGSNFYYHRPGILFVLSSGRFFTQALTLRLYARADYNIWQTARGKFSRFDFRIYRFAINYKLGEFNISFGRIFPNSAPGLGNTDGAQLVVRKFNTDFGIIIGTQPDRSNYSIGVSSPKFSVFASRKFNFKNMFLRSTLSYSRVMKNMKLDEEFIYIQNNFSYSRLLYIYQSAQFDLNDISNGVRVRKLSLRNIFASIGVEPVGWVRLGLDLSAYRSAYLFETMKNIPDSLFDRRMREDLRGRVRFMLPFNIQLGLMGSVKFLEGELKNDYFASSYISAYDILSTGIDFRLNYSYIKSRFTKIQNAEISLGRDFFDGLLDVELEASAYSYLIFGDKFLNLILRSSFVINISRNYSLIFDLEKSWEKDFDRFTLFAEIGYRF